VARPLLPDHERCTAKTSKGERCRCRRIDGREQCDVHDELWNAYLDWLTLDVPLGSGSGVTSFDLDRAQWDALREA
jgi:hypothetical protein